MGTGRWKVSWWKKRGGGKVLIYEGEAVEVPGDEKVSFHFTIREDIFSADILAETSGGYRFVDFLKEWLGEPGADPLFIFHGEFGDGVPSLPVSAWWDVNRDEALSFIEKWLVKSEVKDGEG